MISYMSLIFWLLREAAINSIYTQSGECAVNSLKRCQGHVWRVSAARLARDPDSQQRGSECEREVSTLRRGCDLMRSWSSASGIEIIHRIRE